MGKFKVVTRVYDDMTIKCSMMPAAADEESTMEERMECDVYIDVFSSEKEAQEFYEQCLKEEKANV